MMVRSLSIQWVLFVIFIVTIFYLKLKITYLEENSKWLNNAIVQTKEEIKNSINDEIQKVKEVDAEESIVVYNRVPKTGSTSFVGLAYDLCKQNNYHVLHINVTNNMHTLTLPNQIKFAYNISKWNSIKPAFYHGHIAFLNFEKFGIRGMPLYLNLLRKPLDRFVSYYYFLRYGDNFRPHLIRKKHGDTKTFDECVAGGLPDCDPNGMWLQIPFLCGHDPACWEVGNGWALEEAKRNIRERYLLVGVTEELKDFVLVLQTILPQFFKGAHDIFIRNNKSHLRQTTQKLNPLPETIEKIQRTSIWKMENELYNYALNHFHALKKRFIDASFQDSHQRFMYEKIRPK
ncbi:heparin sulfate O-sulfotransferase-like [Prorops nasuta]|uniref:heparin sulfate O-sulfotransferase-like n=1 Tax=Prorops nasuta TaxID=863751 RepID=UPI0034CD13DA